MGSTTFTARIKVPKSTSDDEAFNQAVSDARHEHGNGRYTGTLAEKSSFLRLGVAANEEAAMKMADAIVSEPWGMPELYRQELRALVDDKWGDAGAIRYPISKTEDGLIFFGWASC